jgi:quercetin dioxygenase-like cupin family protein
MSDNSSSQRRRMEFFFARDAKPLGPEMMVREGVDEGVLAGLDALQEAGFSEGDGDRTRVLFGNPDEDGMSLIHLWFKSGYLLPFHSHNVDCLYYVLAGELRIGSHVLGRGDGFLVPADVGYGYEAGPEGVEVLEFRNATAFNLVFRGNNRERLGALAKVYRERSNIWQRETTPPSER